VRAQAHEVVAVHAQHPKKLGDGAPNTIIKWVQVLCLDPTIGVNVPQHPK